MRREGEHGAPKAILRHLWRSPTRLQALAPEKKL